MLRLLVSASFLLFVVFLYAQFTTAHGATDQRATTISVTS